MKEIIYIQAGRFSNYIGSHFWNAQQNYFTYGEDAEESIVDHDISFREGANPKGESTFSPRLLLFDRKGNFGAVPSLYETAEDADEDTELWGDNVVQYRQDPIPLSQYHAQIEAGESTPNEQNKATEPRKIRYWSDYSLVYYHPRSLQRLPDVPEWEEAEGDWISNGELFNKYDDEYDLMEGEFRAFVEECDNLQGMQLLNDTATFGSFTNAFLIKFRDDFTKLPCLAFPSLSRNMPQHVDADNGIKQVINDALSLQALCELATITTPLQSPHLWNTGDWLDGVDFDRDSLYHSSALLSAHIESATLPLRLKGSANDLSSLTSLLNWHGDTRLAHLNGALPMSGKTFSEGELTRRIYDLSTISPDPKATYARLEVTRGFSHQAIQSYDDWKGQSRLRASCMHTAPIDLPSSFPNIFAAPERQVSAYSSLQTSARSAPIFAAYGAFANDCLTKHSDVVTRMGVEADEIKELRENMWNLEDSYKQDDEYEFDNMSDDAGLGEDEEY
ncbi:tubulin nucleotide-binding domain-like protein [Trametopsis cervina]|nr:tubulin nucleotide-binding domain-like protein [Trametopsis cervina]